MSEAASVHEPFLTAIERTPDQFEPYGIYSDWLSEQGDPRGEFIQLQWMLENPDFSGPERAKAAKREASLLEQHRENWLGDLAPELTGKNPVFPEDQRYQPDAGYQAKFARGFLDSVSIDYLVPKFAEKLRQSNQIRFLRELTIDFLPYGEQLVDDLDEYADRDWGWDDNPSLEALLGGHWPNLRRFSIGREEDGGCSADDLHRFFGSGTPRIEEISTAIHGIETSSLFAMNMPRLRSLTVDHLTDYPCATLAENASLGSLETISFTPHMLEPGDDPYLQLAEIRALCRSPHLTSLRHLFLQCTNFGDEGIQELINSGMLSRLESLRLPYGATTDEGAAMIVAAPLGNLKHLDLSGHYLSAQGCDALLELAKRSITVKVDAQHGGSPNSGSMEHLWYGDME